MRRIVKTDTGELRSPAQGRALCHILLLLCVVAPASAETSAERGKRVIHEALQALGGNAYLGMEDRIEAGRAYSFYREELSGLSIARIYTRYLTPAPGQLAVRERQAFGKDESSSVLFTENAGWEITYRGARPLTDQRWDAYKDSTLRNIFYILRQRLDEPGMIFESKGADLYQNVPVEVVEITDGDNRTVTVYFTQSSKLPLAQSFKRRNPKTNDWDEEVMEFAKYRDVGGGVQWPHQMRRSRNGEKTYEIFSDSVQINRNLTDDRFTLPGSVKILPKAK